jgi:hypothetical protein
LICGLDDACVKRQYSKEKTKNEELSCQHLHVFKEIVDANSCFRILPHWGTKWNAALLNWEATVSTDLRKMGRVIVL